MFSKGLWYMVLSGLLFTVMGVLVKLAGKRLPYQQVVLARAAVALLIGTIQLRLLKIPLLGHNRRLLLLRGGLGCVALYCVFYSLTHLPLADATVIQFLAPVFVTVLAALFLKEPIHAHEMGCAVVSLLGVLLVARPKFIFGAGVASLDPLAVAVAVLGAVATAAALTTVRHLRRTEHPLVVVLYLPLIATPATIPVVIPGWVWPSAWEWALLFAVGATTQLAQIYMTRGLHLEPAGRAMGVSYLQIVAALVVGIALFGEQPTALSLVGALLIVGGTALVGAPRRGVP